MFTNLDNDSPKTNKAVKIFTDFAEYVAHLEKRIAELEKFFVVRDTPIELPEFVNVEGACKITSFKKAYIYILVHERKIPFHKVGGSLRFSKKELETWIKEGKPNDYRQSIEAKASNHIVKNHKK
jgi:excisionase family DNA binding protein